MKISMICPQCSGRRFRASGEGDAISVQCLDCRYEWGLDDVLSVEDSEGRVWTPEVAIAAQ